MVSITIHTHTYTWKLNKHHPIYICHQIIIMDGSQAILKCKNHVPSLAPYCHFICLSFQETAQIAHAESNFMLSFFNTFHFELKKSNSLPKTIHCHLVANYWNK